MLSKVKNCYNCRKACNSNTNSDSDNNSNRNFLQMT